ncbi:hypothetical protein [Rhizobium sp. H4]|uniref:hypothetical protein n=1 Tax=Rhizobium sp. H4 TaxID=2035449 RepID=UPI000D0E6090|nr:hypothetical protein [Rhizobium sp. H4]
MTIFREVALWISGILGFACLAVALAVAVEKIAEIPQWGISHPLVLAFPLIFVCIRLWILERRSTQR